MAQQTHPIMKWGTSGSIQHVNPNDRDWQSYLSMGYAGIRALIRLRWPSTDQAAAAATISTLTPSTVAQGAGGGIQSVAVVGTNFVVGQTQFTMNGFLIGGTGATSATAATLSIPTTLPPGVYTVRAVNPGRSPSAGTSFTIT
jgi:hypothetical protein